MANSGDSSNEASSVNEAIHTGPVDPTRKEDIADSIIDSLDTMKKDIGKLNTMGLQLRAEYEEQQTRIATLEEQPRTEAAEKEKLAKELQDLASRAGMID
jgi:chromosome segregation ATPase